MSFVSGASPSAGSLRLPILKVAGKASRVVQLLSDEWLHLSTHWAGRTLLCAGEGRCDLCEVSSTRHLWYLPALCVATDRVGILELSNVSSANIEQTARLLSGGFRAGCLLELRRKSAKRPILADAAGWDPPRREIALHEWRTPVMAVYGLPRWEAGESPDEYSARCELKVLNMSRLAAASLGKKS